MTTVAVVKPLTVQNVEVSTAAVEVKTIQVSRKQMTLSMFRQLIDERLIGDGQAFRGNPWGCVNYHHECGYRTWHQDWCDDFRHGRHLHVVWQKGSDLRKATVYERDWCTYGPAVIGALVSGPEADRLVQAAYCTNDHRLPDWMGTHDGTKPWPAYLSFPWTDGLICRASPPRGHANPPWQQDEPGLPCGDGQAYDAALRDFGEHIAWRAAEAEGRVRYAERWAELQDLPQLFIAV